MYKEVKEENPSYSDEQISRTLGDIWFHKLDNKKRLIRHRYGKEYGTK